MSRHDTGLYTAQSKPSTIIACRYYFFQLLCYMVHTREYCRADGRRNDLQLHSLAQPGESHSQRRLGFMKQFNQQLGRIK